MAKISNVKACVFDAYGTLFDVHSAIGQHKDRLGDKAQAVSFMWRDKQLQYTWLRSLMKSHADFWQVTNDALAYALEANGFDDPALKYDLAQAYLELSCYPEVVATLEQLKAKGYKLGILSNGAPAMLNAAVKNANLTELMDEVLSVENVGIYKPDPSVYQLACDKMNVGPEEVCFLSSNAWDAAGAATFGFNVVWINRFAQPHENLPGTEKAEIQTLDQLLNLVEP
ncbi:MAG: haloacid dehalogenase type II [Alphaproteobacteria bacterium]